MGNRFLWSIPAALCFLSTAGAAQFVPLDAPGNAVLQGVAKQIQMSVEPVMWIPKAYVAEMVFSNSGPIASAIDGIYFDNSRSGVMTTVSVFSQTPGINFGERYPAEPLPGGNQASPPFLTTYQISAAAPVGQWGLRNGTAPLSGQEYLFLWLGIDPYRRDDLPAALAGRNGAPLRIGVHVSAIEGYGNGGSATFLYDNVPAVPEPAIWGAMVLGMGFLAIGARRPMQRGQPGGGQPLRRP